MSSQRNGVWTIDPLQDERWPEFVAVHPKATAFHGRGWLKALQATYGYEPVAFTTSAPDEPLTDAVPFCAVRSWLTGRRLVSLPFSDHCEPLIAHQDKEKRLLAHLMWLKDRDRLKYVEMRSAGAFVNAGQIFSPAMTYHLHRLDLRPGLDALYKSFHKNCIQRKIHRAERESLQYQAGCSPLLFRQFYRLHEQTRARHHLPAQPYAWFQNLMRCMEKDVSVRIAYQDGRPIAGILTLVSGRKMFYKYGASDAEFHRLGATPMLFWRAIQEAKEAGIDELDLGRSDLENLGLIAFKDRWSAVRSSLTIWRTSENALSPFLAHAQIGLGRAICAYLPNSLLSLVGRLLYRHIG